MVRRYVVDNGINCKALHEPVKLFSCHGAKVIGITRPGKEKECVRNKKFCMKLTFKNCGQ